ncbi:MAG: 50S ribosomal protein L13 [Halanaerobiales bacterium]|nr:50S ribosomal protein L13 [Halanaerobiales bacterium]
MTTYMAKPDEVDKKWYVVDAEGKTLGRIASRIATVLRGKHKPEYTPHVDTGDFVIVVNSEKVTLTGNKWDQKNHYKHSQYPGGLKSKTYRELREKNPQEIIRHAVDGMVPNNKLGKKMMKKLKIYAGPDHPHQAQEPEELEV